MKVRAIVLVLLLVLALAITASASSKCHAKLYGKSIEGYWVKQAQHYGFPKESAQQFFGDLPNNEHAMASMNILVKTNFDTMRRRNETSDKTEWFAYSKLPIRSAVIETMVGFIHKGTFPPVH